MGADGQLVGEDENSNLDYGDSLFVKNASLEEAGQVFKEVTDVGEMDIPFQKFLRNSESHRSFTRAEKLFRTLMVINFILMVSVPLLAEQLPRLEVVTCLASFCFLLLNFFAASDIAVRVDRRRVEAEMRDFVRLNKLDIGEDRESLTQLRDAALVPENAKAREMLRKLKDSLRGK